MSAVRERDVFIDAIECNVHSEQRKYYDLPFLVGIAAPLPTGIDPAWQLCRHRVRQASGAIKDGATSMMHWMGHAAQGHNQEGSMRGKDEEDGG